MKGRRFGVAGVAGKPSILSLVPLCVYVYEVHGVNDGERERERERGLLTSPQTTSRDRPA